MGLNPKWARTLTENDFVVVAGLLTCGALLIIRHLGWLPLLPWWVVFGLWAVLFFFFFLTVLKACVTFVEIRWGGPPS